MKGEINLFYNGGEDAHLLQSVAILFNLAVVVIMRIFVHISE